MTEIKLKIPGNIRRRSAYLDKVMPFVGKPIIKVLTGQRRVGKSYLLFQIIQWICEQEKMRLFFTSIRKTLLLGL